MGLFQFFSATFSLLFLLFSLTLFIHSNTAQVVEILQITEISHINDTRKSVTVDTVIDPSLNAMVLLTFPAISVQFSIYAERSDESNKVFEIDFHEVLDASEGAEVLILFQVLDMDNNIVGIAEAHILHENMDPRLVAVIHSNPSGDVLLRVDTGDLDFIQIREELCMSEESPCYFNMSSVTQEPIKWCTDVDNDAGGGAGTVSLCNEEVSVHEEIPEGLEPTLLLLDRRNLTVFFSTSLSAAEVLIVDPDDGSLLSNGTMIHCVDAGSEMHSCSLLVDIPEAKATVTCIVVFLDDKGYFNSSKTIPFEISPFQLEYQNEGAVYMTWTSEGLANFTVYVSKGLDSNEIKFQMSVVCGQSETETIPCYLYFIRLQKGDVITMLRDDQKHANAITVSLPGANRGFLSSEIERGI